MTYWTVPPMFAGRTVAVLASGPSMSQEAADRVQHLPRIVVNTTYRLAPDADLIYSSDGPWWKAHPDALECTGIKVSIEDLPGHRQDIDRRVLILRNSGRRGFDPNPDALRTHNNSGACAVQIAAHAKAARILLVGMDMDGDHWHGPHPDPLTNPTPHSMAEWRSDFRELTAILAGRGIDVVRMGGTA